MTILPSQRSYTIQSPYSCAETCGLRMHNSWFNHRPPKWDGEGQGQEEQNISVFISSAAAFEWIRGRESVAARKVLSWNCWLVCPTTNSRRARNFQLRPPLNKHTGNRCNIPFNKHLGIIIIIILTMIMIVQVFIIIKLCYFWQFRRVTEA